jgi:hypothetical protein
MSSSTSPRPPPASSNAAVKSLYASLASVEAKWEKLAAAGAKLVAGAQGDLLCAELSQMRSRLEELYAKHPAEMGDAVARWRGLNKTMPVAINEARQVPIVVTPSFVLRVGAAKNYPEFSPTFFLCIFCAFFV